MSARFTETAVPQDHRGEAEGAGRLPVRRDRGHDRRGHGQRQFGRAPFRKPLMLAARAKPAAMIAILISALGLAACGESSSEKATKEVCSATSEIRTQIKKLETLPITSSFPTEAKASTEAIDKSISKIKEASPNLSSARKEEINAANKSFQTEIASITSDVVSASKSSNLEAALKNVEPRIKAALSTLSSDYKKAFEELKCS